jgi:hypothetical protein
MQKFSSSVRFLLFWVLAFLSFPIAGLFSNLMDAVSTSLVAVLAGAILGLIQWLVLRSQLSLSMW